MQQYAISNRQGIKAHIFTDLDELYNKYLSMCDTSIRLHNLESILYDLEIHKYFVFLHKNHQYYILKLAMSDKPEHTLPEYSFFKKNNSKDTFYTNDINEIYKKCSTISKFSRIGSIEYVLDTLKKNGYYEFSCNTDKYYIIKLKNEQQSFMIK